VTFRVGLGYDSHRFQPPGPLILGGVRIPFDNHLHGHSDGDAVCHALTDAILGAAGAGDIGEMFSDKDFANAGRDSVEMLGEAMSRVRRQGFRVEQADVTIIAESPRMTDHKAGMRARLAAALGVDVSAISVKAKSNEGMGWIGRGEGIACVAVATLSRA
jgi:2-C-methyl-D-erythritol 2,4-cyclodiphosphate synthase